MYNEKDQPNLENEISEKLINLHLKEEKDEITKTKSLKWKLFKKLEEKVGIHEMKRKVRKWLGRERSDIREKIELIRQNYVRELKNHKSLIEEINNIEIGNKKKGTFMPLLEEAMEKNRSMLRMNYKDHINKILCTRMENYWMKCKKENQDHKKRLKRLIGEANYQRKEILEEHQNFKEVFCLFGEVAYSQNKENPIRVMDMIFETWEDIGKPGMKFFKKEMIGEIETSFVYQLLEEIVTEIEKEFTEESFNAKLLQRKRSETLYDYYCWNLRIITTKKFYENLKRYEEIIYDAGIVTDKEKVTEKIKILLDLQKPNEYFEKLEPKFSIFKEKKKRQIYNGEEIHDADDEIRGNPLELTPDEKWLKKKIKGRKKRVKYREKKKRKKKALLGLIEDGCKMPIELVVAVEKVKEDRILSRREIKKAASKLYGLTVASDEFQRTSNWKRDEKELNSDRTTSEKGSGLNVMEEIYSFKTMLRMLYQAGIVILEDAVEELELQVIKFPRIWYDFAGERVENVEIEPEDSVNTLIIVCMTLFEEFMNTRKMLVTSKIIPTRATNPSPGGPSGANASEHL
jgi:hypothetical protein